jgi:formimidoylglutamate deiminase
VLARRQNESTGERLYRDAVAGGAQALDLRTGSIEVGHRADIVVLDSNDPQVAAAPQAAWLDIYLFVLGKSLVKDVFVAGQRVVQSGAHRDESRVAQRYREVLARLAGG